MKNYYAVAMVMFVCLAGGNLANAETCQDLKTVCHKGCDDNKFCEKGCDIPSLYCDQYGVKNAKECSVVKSMRISCRKFHRGENRQGCLKGLTEYITACGKNNSWPVKATYATCFNLQDACNKACEGKHTDPNECQRGCLNYATMCDDKNGIGDATQCDAMYKLCNDKCEDGPCKDGCSFYQDSCEKKVPIKYMPPSAS